MTTRPSPGARGHFDAEEVLHGERLVATTRLVLFLFRAVIMTWLGLAYVAAPAETTGHVLRAVVPPLYALHSVAVLVWLRRGRISPATLSWLPHALNVVDYAFVVVMSAIPTPVDALFRPQIGAMSFALVLSFSVARVGALQAIVSAGLACASYLVALQWVEHTSFAAAAFVLGSFVAWTTLALRVVVGLRRRADEAMRLGQYTLEGKLGAGGMGVVYKARHRMLRRPTAVKLLQGTKPDDAMLARFEREVQLTAQLTHPNTIAVFDYGRTPDGIFYYAMEYLDGSNLDELVEAYGPLPPERVIHLLLQVCGSLGEAHDAGLIDRDVKPANIVLCERGGASDVVKVLDFGLVKNVGWPSDPATAARAKDEGAAVTHDDTITGTPLYLAPEALQRAGALDARSDLYAVGCVGWFLLAGRPVFEGSTVVEICSQHVHTPPERPSVRLGRPLPADLEDVILACLAKDPTRRPASMHALAKLLAACGSAGKWGADEAREWWRRHRAPVIVAGGAGAANETKTASSTADTLTIELEGRADG